MAFKEYLETLKKTAVPEDLFDELPVCNVIERDTPTHVFSCKFCKVFKNTFFKEMLGTKQCV